MFKFIKQYAERIAHIEIYPLISLMIFLLFFIGLLVYVIRMDKRSVQVLSNIPLDTPEENKPFNF
jgi:cbb3-type cytochrome oxidase subunit 3